MSGEEALEEAVLKLLRSRVGQLSHVATRCCNLLLLELRVLWGTLPRLRALPALTLIWSLIGYKLLRYIGLRSYF
jgi:hypothetical protein